MKPELKFIFAGSILLILVHALLNVTQTATFLGLSAIAGLIPIPARKWWHLPAIACLACLITLALRPADQLVLDTLGSIIPINSAGVLAMSVFITVITISLIAETTNAWFGGLTQKLFRF